MRQQLTEQNQSIPSATQQTDIANIARLARRGLIPQKDLPALRLALQKHKQVGDVAKLPRAQRDVLQRYNSAMSTAALGSNQSIMAVSRNLKKEDYEIARDEYLSEEINTDPPMMMVLKRKGIRIFPDGKRVALYVNEKLGLTFTVPYSTSKGLENPMLGVTEEIVLEDIEQLAEVKEGETKKVKVGDEEFDVHHKTAMDVLKLHAKLNDQNKKLMQQHIKDPEKFKKILKMAAEVK